MSPDPFIHLHLDTQYSLSTGAIKINDLMEKVEQCQMSAVAMTDHGNLFGAIEFYKAARSAGIKPISDHNSCQLY